MSSTDIKKQPFGIKYGVIASLTVIIYGLILNITGFNTSQALGYVNYILIGACMYVAIKQYKEANEGFISLGGGFGLGMLVVAISAVISSVFTYLYMVFIDSSIIEMIKEKQLEELEKQGLTDSQIEQAINMSESFMTPGMITIFALIFMLIFGAIIALILAAITKKPRPVFD